MSAPYVNFNFNDSGYIPSYNFDFGSKGSFYNILKSENNNFMAVWAEANASLGSGRFYVSSDGTFTVVDASIPNIYDYYTGDHGGRAQKILESNDIVDINVGG